MAGRRSSCDGCAQMRMPREQDLLGLDADHLFAGGESDVLETGTASYSGRLSEATRSIRAFLLMVR